MSNDAVQDFPTADAKGVNASGSAGVMLRAAREAAGLHIGAMAVLLKVPVKKLESLEGDRIDLLPDAVFARALASSVCRTLKIDPTPILANLPQASLSRLLPEVTGEKGSFRMTEHGASKPMFQNLPRPFVAVGLAFVLGAVVVAFYPAKDTLSKSIGAVSMVPAAPVAELAMQSLPSNLPVSASHGQAKVDQSVVEVQEKNKSALLYEPVVSVVPASVMVPQITPVQVAPVPIFAASKVPAGSGASFDSTGAVGGMGVMVFKSKTAAWVEVMDAAKVVLLRKTLAAGESVDVSGTVPLSVIVGKADGIEVLVRGKVFDLTPVAKDNVARFEVR